MPSEKKGKIKDSGAKKVCYLRNFKYSGTPVQESGVPFSGAV